MTNLHSKFAWGGNSKKPNANNGEGTSSSSSSQTDYHLTPPRGALCSALSTPSLSWQYVQPVQPVQSVQPVQLEQSLSSEQSGWPIKKPNPEASLHKTKSSSSLRKPMSSSSLQMAKPKAPYKATTAVSKDATEKKRTRNNLQIEDKREIIFITDICKIKFEKISRLYGIARNTINGYIKKDQLRGAGQGYNGKSRLKGFALVSESNIRDGKSEARKVVGEILSVNDFQFLNDGDFESYCNEFRIYVEAVGEVIERSKSTMNPIQPPEMFLSFTLTRCILFSGGLDEAICCEVVGTHRAKRAQIISEEFYVSSIIMTNSSGSWRGSELVKVHVPNMSCVQGQDIYYYQAQDAPLTFHELLHRMDTPGPTRTFLIDEQILEALTAKENRRIPTLENIIVLTVPTRLHSAMPASEFAEIVKKDIQKGYATDPGSHIARLCGYWNNLHASITNGYKRFSSEIFLDAYQNHTSILTDE